MGSVQADLQVELGRLREVSAQATMVATKERLAGQVHCSVTGLGQVQAVRRPAPVLEQAS